MTDSNDNKIQRVTRTLVNNSGVLTGLKFDDTATVNSTTSLKPLATYTRVIESVVASGADPIVLDGANGNAFAITMNNAGDSAFSVINPTPGSEYIFIFIQTAASTDIIPAGTMLFAGGFTALTGGTATDVITAYYDGTNFHCILLDNM